MKLNRLASQLLTASAFLLPAAAIAQPAPAAPPSATTEGGTMNRADNHKLDSADKNFLENAAHGGATEVEGSRLAQEKATSPDVKAFANQMIQDHTKVNQELAALAKQKGYEPPTEPALMQKAKLKALSATSGDTFDKMYASQIGVDAHEDAVKLFEKAANEAKDPDVKAFAQKTLPALRHHLEMARALHQKVDGEKK